MARQSNASYWAQRMKNMEDALLDHSYTYVENLDRQFAGAVQEIEKDIAVWYQRFADNNEISLADAKKWLTSGELKELQWTVDEYIKFGKENAVDGAWIKELENASAKVHISRLDALKLQIQQQAEVLHAQVEAATEKAAREIYEAGYYHTGFEVQKGIGLGWSLASIDEKVISKVLSRPWTIDGQTFRDRCWTNKQSLVNTVNQELTRMVIRGEAPDRAISAISKKFDVSRQKAGRLVMTESAYFSSAAQKDCYEELDVEKYKVVESLDTHTCELCGKMDGKVFKMSEYAVGLTAPPFHPWCRGCTCPHFDDMEGIGERYARDAVTGERFKVPKDMTYEEWRAKQNELYGAGTVEKLRTMSYNESTDTEQLKKYQKLLGKDGNLKDISAFQNLKYSDPDGYAALKTTYADTKQWQKYVDALGSNAPASLESFQALKRSDDWQAFQSYAKSIKIGELTPLADFELYQSKSAEIDKVLVGQVAQNGLEITGKSKHYIARTIGSVSQRRSGVETQDALDALLHPIKVDPIKTNANGRSQRFKGKNCYVTVDPNTGILIQTNPHKGG